MEEQSNTTPGSVQSIRSADKASEKEEFEVDVPKHLRFLRACYDIMPQPYESQDNNRLTLLYFVLGSLDLLGKLDDVVKDKQKAIDWIYSLQVLPPKNRKENDKEARWGFRGSPFLGLPWSCDGSRPEEGHYLDCSHIAVTYTAMCALRILGDDFSRIDRPAILEALRFLQRPDGSFCPNAGGSESDMRFIYCAAAISYMLQDWSAFNVDKAVQYVISSQSYEYALAQGPGQEGHGGSTYCGLATLKLIGDLHTLPYRPQLVQWLVERQISGFQGRVNKDPDTCYSFWVGASLHMLDAIELVDYRLSKGFTMSCQTQIGGFSKCPNIHPDILHTYFALCGLSLMGSPGLQRLDCALGMTQRASSGFGKEMKTAREWLASQGC
jgi:geranylgeranyl transferase type-1 subunit beta